MVERAAGLAFEPLELEDVEAVGEVELQAGAMAQAERLPARRIGFDVVEIECNALRLCREMRQDLRQQCRDLEPGDVHHVVAAPCKKWRQVSHTGIGEHHRDRLRAQHPQQPEELRVVQAVVEAADPAFPGANERRAPAQCRHAGIDRLVLEIAG